MQQLLTSSSSSNSSSCTVKHVIMPCQAHLQQCPRRRRGVLTDLLARTLQMDWARGIRMGEHANEMNVRCGLIRCGAVCGVMHR